MKAAKSHAQDIDYLHPRGLKQSLMASLLHCDWINKEQNLLITGPCGSGKTYLACALGETACLKGYSVKYYRISRLMLELNQAKADGSYSKDEAILAKRKDVYLLAKSRNPHRWTGDIRNWDVIKEVSLNPDKQKTEKTAGKF